MRTEICFTLANEEETQRLGQCLAASHEAWQKCILLLDGELGAGKTTLVRALVRALPGGEGAEVSSPSFNLCNIYPTQPQIAHFDLYRLEDTGPDESLFEWLEHPGTTVIVEWARFVPKEDLPPDVVTLHIEHTNSGRAVRMTLTGRAHDNKEALCSALAAFNPGPCPQ